VYHVTITAPNGAQLLSAYVAEPDIGPTLTIARDVLARTLAQLPQNDRLVLEVTAR
jgi:hypothetical protein